jgi:hypothetical protein
MLLTGNTKLLKKEKKKLNIRSISKIVLLYRLENVLNDSLKVPDSDE